MSTAIACALFDSNLTNFKNMETELQMCLPTVSGGIPLINNNYVSAHIEERSREMIYTCNLCKISATSHKVLQRHYEGRKHRMRVERDGKTFMCELCEVTANSQKQLDNHLKSSRHKYNLEKKDIKERIQLNGDKGVWLILFGIVCVFINFLLLFKMCM